MNIITKNRGAGKTLDLIQIAHNKPELIIVCFSKTEAERVFTYADSEGYKINKPITYDELPNLSNRGLNAWSELLIDNLDIYFEWLTKGMKVNTITFTTNN